MTCGIGEEGRALLSIFLILLPASFYIMGLMGGKKGHFLFLCGIFFHIISVAERALTVGSVPLAEKHDTISFMALASAAVYAFFGRKAGSDKLGMVALPLVSSLLIVSSLYLPINTVPPFLKSPWFYLHIFFYFSGYAFFGIAACAGIYYVYSGDSEYEPLQYRGIIYGWVLFSVSLVIGSIWFYVAYGTYWLWTSRELWTTLTWSYYGMYLHARYIRGLTGRPVAIIGSAGFLVALFAYFGVGTIIPAPPTQF